MQLTMKVDEYGNFLTFANVGQGFSILHSLTGAAFNDANVVKQLHLLPKDTYLLHGVQEEFEGGIIRLLPNT